MTLDGRTALVTGASSGIGAHVARVLAHSGADVTAAARREDALASLCSEIVAAGGRARALRLDVTDADGVAAALSGEPYDIVVNNAGISAPGAALGYDIAEWDRTMDTNLRGAFLVGRAAARAMVEAGQGGSIVNVASILGLRVTGHVAAYAASKAGLVQLTRALALEWARHGIRVNALCPGYIETPMNADFLASEAGRSVVARIPQRRIGRPGDLDGALLLFAGDAGSYITGAVLAVDGGHLVSSL